MFTLDTLRREKKAEILHLAGIHGCRNVRVFGSVATGSSTTDSDVDFLVELEAGRNLFDLGGLLADLKDLLGQPVDLVEARLHSPPHPRPRAGRICATLSQAAKDPRLYLIHIRECCERILDYTAGLQAQWVDTPLLWTPSAET
jgi:uncharacterized protein